MRLIRSLRKIIIMKRVIFYVTIILLVMSCVSEDQTKELDQMASTTQTTVLPTEFVELKAQMETLNVEVAKGNEQVITRGFFSGWLKRIIGVTVADAVGGIVCSWFGPAGTAAGATATSGLVAAFLDEPVIEIHTRSKGDDELFPPMNPDDKSMNNLFPGDVSEELLTIGDSIGYFHNRILLDIKNENQGQKLSRDSILACIAQKTSEFYRVDKNEIKQDFANNKELFDFVAGGDYLSVDGEDLHDIIAAWIAKYPNKQGELTLLETFFSGLNNIDVDENDGDYLMKVLKLVDNSELSEEIKRNLRNAFIVGNASYQLWNVPDTRE